MREIAWLSISQSSALKCRIFLDLLVYLLIKLIDMFIPNHLHLIVKGTFKNPPTKVEDLNNWFSELVEKVRMVVVAGPTSVYVDAEGNEGLTGTVTLATSHGSFHCWEKYNPSMFQFDLYSCSCFTVEEVIEHLNEFELISYTYMMVDRNDDDGFKVLSSGNVTI